MLFEVCEARTLTISYICTFCSWSAFIRSVLTSVGCKTYRRMTPSNAVSTGSILCVSSFLFPDRVTVASPHVIDDGVCRHFCCHPFSEYAFMFKSSRSVYSSPHKLQLRAFEVVASLDKLLQAFFFVNCKFDEFQKQRREKDLFQLRQPNCFQLIPASSFSSRELVTRTCLCGGSLYVDKIQTPIF